MDTESVRVRDVMSADTVTVDRNDTLSIPDEAMRKERIRHLLVLDADGELCGVISQRDLFRGALLRALGYGTRAEQVVLDSVLVKEVMSEDPKTISPDASLAEAARRMRDEKIGCLPVLDGRRLVGIITEGDMVALVAGGSAKS